MLAPAAAAMNGALAPYERVLLVGGRGFMAYPYTRGSALPESTDLLHLSPEPSQLGRVYATRWAAVGDPKATITALLPLVRGRAEAGAVAVAIAAADVRRRAAVEQLEDTALSRYDASPMDPMAAAHALVRAMPAGSLIVDEAITTGVYVRGFHHELVPGRYFFNRGGGQEVGEVALELGVALDETAEAEALVVFDDEAAHAGHSFVEACRPLAELLLVHGRDPAGLVLVRRERVDDERPVRGDGHRRPAGRLPHAGAVDGRGVNAGREGP